MKKFLALLLIFIMTIATFTACKTNEETSENPSVDNTSSDTTEPTSEVETTDPYDHLKDLDFDKAVITIFTEGDALGRYKSIEVLPHEESPEIIQTAVIERNQIVEELLNVVINEKRTSASNEMLTLIRNTLLGNESEYDITMPYMPAAATLAIDGSFFSLNRPTSGSSVDIVSYIKLDKPYWDQRANSDLSIDGNIFFSSGDFSILTMDCTHAIVFNKTLIKNNTELDDPYELLETGKWTLDAMYKNAKIVSTEYDGEEGMTYKDIFGLYLNSNYPTSMFIGANERLVTKDSNDLPILALGSATAPDVVDKLIEIVNDKSATLKIETISFGSEYSDVWSAATGAFADNRVLFRAIAITDLNELAEYEVEYGILPTPKYSEEQENYNNIVSAIYASCFAIPVNVKDPVMSAAVVEAMAITSTNTLKVQYYENVLKNRRMPAPEDENALDIIFQSRSYEQAKIFDIWGMGNFIDTIVNSGINTYSSSYEANKSIFEQEIEKTVNSYLN